MKKYYRCKYSFNASHSLDGSKETMHNHTFSIVLSVRNNNNDEMEFASLEHIIQIVLSKYNGSIMNEEEEFQGLIPSIEVIGDVLFDKLEAKLVKESFVLSQLEISDNPLKQYIISSELLLPMQYLKDGKEYLDSLLAQK